MPRPGRHETTPPGRRGILPVSLRQGERGLKKLIVTGDDFGLSLPVNEAISKAHETGILTTASLMVAAPEAADALRRARSLPSLNVGLHLVLSSGVSVLSPAVIPDLVDAQGRFSQSQVAGAIRIFLLPRARRQMETEIRAQFEAFARTGLRLDHVNGHQHMHLHPTVLDALIRIGRDYGLKAVRVPEERPLDALIDSRSEWIRRHARWLFLKPWTARMKRRLRAAGLDFTEQVFGLHDSGHMTLATLIRILAHLPDGVWELYCHPATGRWQAIDPLAADYDFEAEYSALVHPRTRRTLEKFSIGLCSFGELRTCA